MVCLSLVIEKSITCFLLGQSLESLSTCFVMAVAF